MPQGPAAAEHSWLTLRAARDVCCAQCQVKSQIKLWHHKEYHMKKGPRARVVASVDVGTANASLQNKVALFLRLESCEVA